MYFTGTVVGQSDCLQLLGQYKGKVDEAHRHTRQGLLAATPTLLEKAKARVASGRLRGRSEIALRVRRVGNECKVAKHFRADNHRQAFRVSGPLKPPAPQRRWLFNFTMRATGA